MRRDPGESDRDLALRYICSCGIDGATRDEIGGATGLDKHILGWILRDLWDGGKITRVANMKRTNASGIHAIIWVSARIPDPNLSLLPGDPAPGFQRPRLSRG